MTAGNTRAMATVVPTGETLIRPRAPTARVRTQRVTHVAVCNWTPNNAMKNHSNTQSSWSFCLLFITRTTFCHRPVAVEAVGPDSAAPEQLRPVHRVVVAQVGVLTDVHAAIADLPQGAQAQ